jgi:hypothetical protein
MMSGAKILGLIKGLLFAVILFISVEFAYRFYVFGPLGLNTARMVNYTNLLRSGLVQPSASLDIWYELKPNLNTWFRGAPFITNSRGLADKEYSLKKPPGVFRVAVVGSSWTMGSGVPLEQVFHSVLEAELNADEGAVAYEFINFGVENYGLGEIVATVANKVPAYKPDLILVVITDFTPVILWEKHSVPFNPQPDSYSGLHSLVLIKISALLGSDARKESKEIAVQQRKLITAASPVSYMEQVERAFNELAELGNKHAFDTSVVWLHAGVPQPDKPYQFVNMIEQVGIAGLRIDILKYLEEGQQPADLLVNEYEKHPSAMTHRMIAVDMQGHIVEARRSAASP